jgi:hypothetical protein
VVVDSGKVKTYEVVSRQLYHGAVATGPVAS